MSGRLLGFEHVGMAVSDLDASIAVYCDLLGLDLVLRKQMPNGKGELAFLDTGNGQLELICPDPGVAAPAPRLPDTSAGIRHLTSIRCSRAWSLPASKSSRHPVRRTTRRSSPGLPLFSIRTASLSNWRSDKPSKRCRLFGNGSAHAITQHHAQPRQDRLPEGLVSP